MPLAARFKANARTGLMAKLGRGKYDPKAAAKIRPAEPRTERALYLRYVNSLFELWSHFVADRLELHRSDAAHARADAGPLLVADWDTLVDQSGLNGMLERVANSIADRNQTYFSKVLKNPVPKIGKQADTIADFKQRNVGLIKGLGQKQVDDLNSILSKSNALGVQHADLAEQIQDKLGVGAKRARLIARDQTLKYNSSVHTAQAKSAGVTKFRWSTSHDGDVRPMHKALEGKIFSYEDPPVTNEAGDHNLPGEDYQCRCAAIPILDLFEGIDDVETDPGLLPPPQKLVVPVAPEPELEPVRLPVAAEAQPLAPYAERLADYTQRADRFASFAEDKPEVLAPIKAYTSRSGPVNMAARRLAKGLEVAPEAAQMVVDLQQSLDAAVDAGHAVPGRAYRGLDAKPEIIEALKTGKFTTASFMSTSIDPIEAEAFMLGNQMRMTVAQKTGIPLESVTSVKGEKEILLRSGTNFQVDSMVRVHGVWEVHLTEI